LTPYQHYDEISRNTKPAEQKLSGCIIHLSNIKSLSQYSRPGNEKSLSKSIWQSEWV